MNDSQVYQLETPGRRKERLQASKPAELKLGLVRLGLPESKANSIAGAIWGERGGVIQGPGYRVAHLGSMCFVPIAQAAEPRSRTDVETVVLKPRSTRPSLPAEPVSDSRPSPLSVDDQQLDRLFQDLEGQS